MIVTIFKDIKTTSTGFYRPVHKILDRIKNGDSKTKVESLRAETDKTKQKQIKESLPSICFSGEFASRSKDGLIKHSGLICLDFDKFEDDFELLEVRRKIIDSEYTYSCFISPSGNGLKVIVKIPALVEFHEDYFRGLQEYFDNDNFDQSTKDVSRVCFESYDPDIYINENSSIFDIRVEKQQKTIGDNNVLIPITSTTVIIDRLLKWFDKNYSMVEGSRNENLIRLAKAFNDFGVPKEDALHTCYKFEQSDFTRDEIEKTINSAYRDTSKHGTKQFEDSETKKKIEYDVRSGKPIKEIKQRYTVENLDYVIDDIKETISINDFWEYSQKGEIKINPIKYKQYLEERKFFKHFPQGADNFVFIEIKENLVTTTQSTHIKDAVLNDLLSRGAECVKAYNYMCLNTKLFKDDFLNILDTIEVNIKEDTKDACYIYFKNVVLEITKEGINEIDYLNLDAYVWKGQVIDREWVELTAFEKSVFEDFIWLISSKDKDRFNSMCCVIGYLMHSFKTSANNRAIIFNDQIISDNPNGGSGKGLFYNALGHMKKVSTIDGKQFDFGKSFAYQTVSPETQILVFDDVKRNFNFENLFSLITEGITIEKKNKDAIHLPLSKSPKVIITTNYTIQGEGGSHERRKFELELSNYFGSHHTPLDEFGHMLFDDWDSLEWQKFDNFMIYCTQQYMKKGLIPYKMINLEQKIYINKVGIEFYEWANDDTLPHNKNISKNIIFDEFIKDNPDCRTWMKQKKFTLNVKQYCIYNNLEYSETRQDGVSYFIITKN